MSLHSVNIQDATQAEQSFKPQLEEVRREAAAALMQASLAQRALSRAQEAWQAERSALGKELADNYEASPQQASDWASEDWNTEGKQLLRACKRVAMRMFLAEGQVVTARQAQVCKVS